jgi:hypothetical protein
VPRDAWTHPAAVGASTRPAFPRRRRDAREATGKGERKVGERGEVAA